MLPLLLNGGVCSLGIQIAAALLQVPAEIVASQLPMAAPIPTSPAEWAHRRAVDELMCQDSEPWMRSCGYPVPGDADGEVVNRKMMAEPQYRPSTYGEVTCLGARQLFYHMGMSSSKGDDEIVFMDLGSGVGRLVVQAYMELPRLSRAIGIELAPRRHQRAVSAWAQLESSARAVREESRVDSIPIAAATVELLEGDIFHANVSEATHIYISSLCFSDEMMHQLATKLEREASNLQCVATLRPFPREFERRGIDRATYEIVLKTLGMTQRVEFVEMSWTEPLGCHVVVYTKPR